MLKKISCLGLLCAAFVTFASPVHATVIDVTANGAWHAFDVDDFSSQSGGLEWIDLNDGSALAFALTLTGDALLTVVDGGFAGDQFKIFDNGVLLGQTSTAINSFPNSVGLNFDAALANSNYSQGVFSLGAGAHKITGILSKSALDDDGLAIDATVGAIKITVPEQTAASLMVLALAALSARRLRRRSGRRSL